MRGSQAMRATTRATMTAASARRNGSGRCAAIQAMPGTMRARPTVSQPFSIANVRVSASEATAPVAKIACAAGTPGRGARRPSCSVATANSAASSSARPANGIERSQPATR